jgi:hypothetical protein
MKTFTRANFAILDHFYAIRNKCEALSIERLSSQPARPRFAHIEATFHNTQERLNNSLQCFYGSLSKLTNVSSALKEKILKHISPNQG